MADKNAIYQDGENSESSENLSHSEWTIIGENYSEKDDTDEGNNSTDGTNEDEEPSKSLEVISMRNIDATIEETGGVIMDNHDEESDGISVITESEAEHLIGKKKFHEIDNRKNNVYGALKMYEKTGENTAPQVGTILNVVIACSLAAIIGLGVGRILGMDDKCDVTDAIDFSTIKIESDNLINQMKELSEVKDVLAEIKASIPHVKRAQEKMSQHGSKSRSKYSERQENPSKISDAYIFDPDTTILEQLQTSLNTLCSVLDGMNPENDFIKSDTSRTQSVVADLIEFQQIIYTVVKELEETGRPKEMEFLRHAERRIRDVCESLLGDLSYTIHGVTMKIHHKLNKVRHKLNRRLCLLKNSESMDGKIFRSLEENNSFLESCDKILNVTLKPSPKSMKTDEKEKLNTKKIYSNKISSLKKSLPKKTASESEDDSYPRDSSSDSSIPDLTYNPKDHDFGRKKKTPRQGGKGSNQKSGKILLENDSKLRKIRNIKSMKSKRGQSLRKLMMDVLVPTESCPLAREHWLESEYVYPETQRLEVPILNSKPLYSTVLKTVINDVSSAKNDKPANTKAYASPETIEQRHQEFRVEPKVVKAKEVLRETQHNVTPAESGINVQTMKEQSNTKIRVPIGKYNGVPQEEETAWSEKIPIEKHKDPKQLVNNVEDPSLAGSLKHCRKGKKCLSNDSAASTGSYKKRAPTTSHTDNNKHTKSSTEKTVIKSSTKLQNDNVRKPKKVKNKGKIQLSSTKTDPKVERGFKKRSDNKKTNDQLAGDWQLRRSRAREMHRDRGHRSEWFFDRADSRQDARKDFDELQSTKSRAGRYSRYQPCEYYRRNTCEPIYGERINDEEFYNYSHEAKDVNDEKHLNSRAGFAARKMFKTTHRKNIMQSKRH